MTESAMKIQKWWKSTTSTVELRAVHTYLTTNLNIDDLQELSNKCSAITDQCGGNGAGLSGGTLIDMFVCHYFNSKLTEYVDFRKGESDMKICDIPLSLKKINGKSIIALNWSKNKQEIRLDNFDSHIIILNLKSEKWWKKSPKKITSSINIIYNDTILCGLYIIDKPFCKQNIILSQNNKTNTLIDSQMLYMMLKRSIFLNLFIELPKPDNRITFNIMNAFS